MRKLFWLCLLSVGLLVPVVAASGAGAQTASQSAPTSQDIRLRDQLIADQENLLNTYRCMFGVDTHAVPGGCGEPGTVAAGAAPQNPAQSDLEVRDGLIQSQEALLNAYRCQFNIDTQLVPSGCAGQTGPQPTGQPESTPVPPAPDRRVLWGFEIFNDGSLALELGGLTNRVGLGGCIVASTFTLNDGEYGYHEAWWERDAGSGWREVAGSRRSGKVCGFDLSSAPPGKYRMVLDATIAGARGVYKSRNEITKQPNTESQTEPERTTTTTEPSTTTPSCPPNTPTADWLSWGFWVSATTTQVQTQLRCEADIHAKDDRGWTPLHIAAALSDDPAVIQALIAAGADIHAKDDNGLTPLHRAAAFSDDPGVIQALLAAGANPTMRSNSGETPLDVARDWENSAAVQVLSQAVALTDTSGNDAPRAPVVVANSGDPTRYEVRFVASFDARETRAYDFQFREKGTGDHWRVETCDTFENPESRPLSSVTAAIGVRGAEPATTYEVRYRYRNSSRCGQGTPGPWSQIGEGTTAMTS